MPGAGGGRHLLTIAVEDQFDARVLSRHLGERQRRRLASRIEEVVPRALGVLERAGATATFLFMGSTAAAHPGAVRAVAAAGHEPACRTWEHASIDEFTPDSFREDVSRARAAVESAAGRAVHGFRIPRGRFTGEHTWALRTLTELGFRYDSSVYPRRREAHGRARVRFPHVMAFDGREIVELPISSPGSDSLLAPVGGGARFRHLPRWVVRMAVDDWTRRYRSPFMMYFNLWEFDDELPRLRVGGVRTRAMAYRNAGRAAELVEMLAARHTLESVERHLERVPYATKAGSARGVRHGGPVEGDGAGASWVERRIERAKSGEAPEVTIVVPCLNERETVPYLHHALRELEEETGRAFAYVFVDDGSTDGTPEVLERTFEGDPWAGVVRHGRNRGIGAAIMTGIEAAGTDVVASIDADCTYDPRTVVRLLPELTVDVAMVTASPYHPEGTVVNAPRWRIWLSGVLSRGYRGVLSTKLHTYTSCCRVYRREVVSGLGLEQEGFLALVEMVERLAAAGHGVREVPAELESRITGRSKMAVARVGVAHLRNLVGCWRRGRSGAGSDSG